MKTLKSVLIFLILLNGINSYSQTTTKSASLKGKITEEKTGQPIAFVPVQVYNSKGINIGNATSDIAGNYHVKNLDPEIVTVKVNFLGYQKFEGKNIALKSQGETIFNIQLKSATLELQEVMVLEEEVDIVKDKEVSAEVIGHQYSKKRNKNSGIAYKTTTASNYAPVNEYGQLYNTEGYSPIVENDFKNVSSSPLSTFSIDVDVASYANLRRFISNGQQIPRDAVRIEEMINYFTYDYPQPKDEHPFAIYTEISDCPWNTEHQLVHIGIQGEKIDTKQMPPNNLVFLIDVSGSMGTHNKLPLLKKSLKLLVEQMREEDKIAIVVYAGAAGLVLPSTSGANKSEIIKSLDKLQSGGSTAGGAGIKLAYKVAQENFIKNGNNRVILATDGDFNVGASSDADMASLIEQKRNTGIYLTCLGFGMGNYKDSKMEVLADKGNGNYAYIDNLMEAKKVLVSEMGGTLLTIAKDVKIQIEFNPNKVASYKLIGYENRLLNSEDFNDDTKDAGELGSGHTVTALYEIVPKNKGEKANVDPLRYQNVTNNSKAKSDELMTVKFRYKKPIEDNSKLITHYLKDIKTPLAKASDNFKFSAGVALFGMIVRDSKHKGNATVADVLKLVKEGKGQDPNGYRSEFIKLVEMYELQASK
ncbi:MAG: VWA domain-containing protein [Vicingaceae bacterium]